jgi:uncharacterized damage-inducible protein DinB
MKQTAVDYAAYNLWADERMVTLFRQADPSLLSQEVVSSFPSLRLTLLHLWAVEDIWFERLNGRSPQQFLSTGFTGTDQDIFDGLIAQSVKTLRFIAAQPEAYFTTPLQFNLLTASGQFTHTPAEMIQHLFNHQTSHRGQLITMGRQLGITDFPRTDYIIWAREKQNTN